MKTKTKFILVILLSCICSILIYERVDRVKEVKIEEDILTTQENIENEFLADTSSYTIDNPKVIVNPYGISPLTGLIIFETKDLTTPTVTIPGVDENSTITHTFTPNKKHILPIYGLYPDKDNEVILTVNNKNYVIHMQTETLPEDFIMPTSVDADKEELGNELYFVTPSSTGYTAAYDVNGDVRWYLTENFIWDIKCLDNGNLLLSSNRLINPPYYTTGLIEMNFLGKIYFEYTMPGGYHHDVYEMENGNFLVASDSFEDGTVEESEPGEFEFERDEFEHATYEIIEYIAIEQNEEINQIDIKAYERSDTDESIKNIMEYKIDLNTNKIEAENKDVLIYDPKNSIITDEYKIYYKVFYGVEYDEAEYYHNKEDENHETEIDEELEISKDGKETEVSEETEKNLLEEKVTNNSMVAYAVNSRNESHAIIKATKNGKTISKEVEMNGLVDKAETIEIPTIGIFLV